MSLGEPCSPAVVEIVLVLATTSLACSDAARTADNLELAPLLLAEKEVLLLELIVVARERIEAALSSWYCQELSGGKDIAEQLSWLLDLRCVVPLVVVPATSSPKKKGA